MTTENPAPPPKARTTYQKNFDNGPGIGRAEQAIRARKRREAAAAEKEKDNPWPSALGAQMRRVFEQDRKLDFRDAEITLRNWLVRRPAEYYDKMLAYEAKEAAVKTAALPGKGKDLAFDEAEERVLELVEILTADMKKKAWRGSGA